MKRIGVNALYLLPGIVGGTEVYLRQLLAALAEIDAANQYFVLTNRETGSGLVPRRPNFHCVPQGVRATSRPHRILWEQTLLPGRVSRLKLDVLLNPGYTGPLLCPCPTVTVFHDLQHLRHPENFSRFERLALRSLLWGSAHRSQRLIAVSEVTAADLVASYGVPQTKVSVIRHGVDLVLFSLDRSRTERFILCVSALRPNKNLERLIRAFAGSGLDHELLLVGPSGSCEGALRSRVAALNLQSRVKITGWVSSDELLRLYRGAHAVVYPSLFEGFGLPVLEAMAAGIPVACSDIAPLRELAGDVALLFDPHNEDAMAAALRRICEDTELRSRISAAGPARARLYTWRRAAEQTLATLLMSGRDTIAR